MRAQGAINPWVSDMAVPLFLIAIVIGSIGGILLVQQFLQLLPFSKRKAKRRGVIPQAIRMFASGCVVLFGVSLFMIALFVGAYDGFTREEPVARIQCLPVEGLDYDMILRFVPLQGGKEGVPGVFRLNGDQWAVGGHILQWHPWLNMLGLHTGYRLTRVEGRYIDAEEESSGGRSVYDLGELRTQALWHWLYRHYEDIPLVKAVYGNTAYTFPERDVTFVVRVTLSGFKVAPDLQR